MPARKNDLYPGLTLNLMQWSKKTGIPRNAIDSRIKKGWPIEKTLTTPVGIKGRHA